MRVVLSTLGKFHTFDLARQMHSRGWLKQIYTGYPRFKLKHEQIPQALIRSFPWLQMLQIGLARTGFGGPRFYMEFSRWSHRALESFVARNLPECDIYVGLSGAGLKPGLLARKRGGIYICDRGSTHLRYQANLLKEEYARHGMTFHEFDPRGLVQDDREYAAADLITVPSTFALRSFVEMGVPAEKLHCIPYGVDLSQFYPVVVPDERRFDVLFAGMASLRKGIPYLLGAFDRVRHPCKRLTFAGGIAPEVAPMIQHARSRESIACVGGLSQPALREVMSRSHVLVLPSVEEGLALVQAQAMACGCPVIGTTYTGAEDLFEDGKEGIIVPIRSPEALAARMQQLADDPDLRRKLAFAALQRVKEIGGWDRYGTRFADLFLSLTGREAA